MTDESKADSLRRDFLEAYRVRYCFHIPGRLPGLNEIVDAARGNRFSGATQKKKATTLCGQWIMASRVPAFTVPVSIHFQWFEPNRRRDLDNIVAGSKFILDALVVTGRLPNDGRAWVRALAHTFPEPDVDNPRVVVSIIPLYGAPERPLKESTRHRDAPIIELIVTGRYTAKEIAARLTERGVETTDALVYNAAYRNRLKFRSVIDRRSDQRQSPGRRFSDKPSL